MAQNSECKGLQPLVAYMFMTFDETQQQPFHIIWVTHNSRVSQRMIEYGVKRDEQRILNNEDQIFITQEIAKIVQEDGLIILAYNILTDHVHMTLVCSKERLPNVVRKLKGRSAQKFKEISDIQKEEQFHLWAQKYSNTWIEDEENLVNAIKYVRNNRLKHGLDENEELQNVIDEMITPVEKYLE